MGRKNADYDKIFNDYVSHPDMTTHKLAEKYGLSYSVIKDKCRKEGWWQKKIDFQKKVRERATDALATKTANALAKELQVAEMASDTLLKAFQDDKQWNRHLVQRGTHDEYWTEEMLSNKKDSRAIKEALQALKIVEDMKRSILEMQKVDQMQKAKIEAERLQIEKERLELEKQRLAMLRDREAVDAGQFGVIVMPPVQEVPTEAAYEAPESPESDDHDGGGINGQ